MSNLQNFKTKLLERLGDIDAKAEPSPEALLAKIREKITALETNPDISLTEFKARVRDRIERIEMRGDVRGNADELKKAFRDLYDMALTEEQRAKLKR